MKICSNLNKIMKDGQSECKQKQQGKNRNAKIGDFSIITTTDYPNYESNIKNRNKRFGHLSTKPKKVHEISNVNRSNEMGKKGR